ncbi:SMP-30/gluconolactonase/LRE family protein [Amycolatopsis rhabdoformis]|uniref:SMP-30/gluconolactonase/LRE family protein n=1 Tax=Amycolatopsis rhabdoformis TaxID=1448059 RepID=A0ABZ1IJ19_9PSEU|nr:SMP-30/gluconolactonase/LRE family protein [Amycolatopsis rhabdoformis]WSE34282.1 SMP-30/gluconolactonase/LRE family protein [Amycolatopsis rhabdoformis]
MAEYVEAVWERFDERFARVGGDSRLERLHGGCRWAEGAVYFPAARSLVWSDIPNDRLLRWDETTGAVGVFRHPAGYANGNSRDRQGRLLTCEQGPRRVTRTEHDGSITVLAERFEGKRFNSPNDLVEAADGAVWFTDPRYGIGSDYEGFRAESEIGADHVYRVDPGGEPKVVADDFERPNGLAFSRDGEQLYVVDSQRAHLRRFEVTPRGTLTGGEEIARCRQGTFDGLRLDDEGRLWVATGGGVDCFDADGTLLGGLKVPETVANLVFGGPKRNILYLCATTSLYSIMLSVTGA